MYKTGLDIANRIHEHALHGINTYNKDWFVIAAQGSMNYGMMDEESDVDTKLLLIPSLEDLVLNKTAISHTLEMPDNAEHVDCKDVRDYFKIFRKSNINFVEILFTDYWVVNSQYYDLWAELLNHGEELARINPYAAVSCMGGMAKQKFNSLFHEYPSRMEYINKFGYDPKQLSHLARIRYFIEHYVENDDYINCIYPQDEEYRAWLLEGKRTGWHLNKEEAEKVGRQFLSEIDDYVQKYKHIYKNENNQELDDFLNNILFNIITRSLKNELKI